MATNKIQTGIRFEAEMLYKISYIAKQNRRSLNAQLEHLADICVKEYEKKNGEIEIDEEKLYNK
ncbi:MAG: Arc family DNA-binding protein [Clostridia bacterium]|nr:Arc family DNA-binding protein [Clostridia bacterium]